MSDQTRSYLARTGYAAWLVISLTMESTYLIGRALGHDLIRGTRAAQA